MRLRESPYFRKFINKNGSSLLRARLWLVCGKPKGLPTPFTRLPSALPAPPHLLCHLPPAHGSPLFVFPLKKQKKEQTS